MVDSVNTFVDEAKGFLSRHPGLDNQQESFGGLLFGAMRAVAECPNCPGHYRVPLTEDKSGLADPLGHWAHLWCSRCNHLWTYQPQVEAQPKSKRKKKEARETPEPAAT